MSAPPKQPVAFRNAETAPLQGLPPVLLPRPFLIFVWASIVLTVAAFVFSVLARHLGYGLPYSNPYYYIPGDRFGDFQAFQDKFKDFGTPAFFTSKNGFFMYPAPMVFVFRPFLSDADRLSKVFLGFLLLIVIFLVFAFRRILRNAGLRGTSLNLFVAAVVILSYPVIFELTRWNAEMVIFLLISLGVWAFWRERFYQAALYFGIAASLKFFPLIFMGLLLARKRYHETLFGVLVALVVTLGALKLLGPTIPQAFAWDNLQMATFREHFAGVPASIGYDHSFFAFAKWVMLPRTRDLTAWVTPYTRTIAISGLLLYFARIWRMPRLNQVLAISVLGVTLPPTSYDYTLLSLYPVFLLLCLRVLEESRRAGKDRLQLTHYFLLFAVIFTPLSFVVWNGGRYAGQLRLLALLAVLVYALVTPMPEQESSKAPLGGIALAA